MDEARRVIGRKPRVFVSSVVDGFELFRQAAREGIIRAGGDPVLANEDFPSLAQSSRNACLDGIASTDYLLSIIGARGGWTTPSGRLVVEEEYEYALSRKLPVLVFLQQTGLDAEATRFSRRLSDYVDGSFRRTFDTPSDLRLEVERALLPLLSAVLDRVPMRRPTDHFAAPLRVQNTTMLRFVLTPEREEEVIDPVKLGSREFHDALYSIGHSTSIRLLSYERSKSLQVNGDAVVISQIEAGGRQRSEELVQIRVAESGELVVDANVSGRVRRGAEFSLMDSLVLAIEDIESVMLLCFRFAATLYEQIDPYLRHQRFSFNAGLTGLGHRALERNPVPRSTFGMSMRADRTVTAYDQPRTVTRGDLASPDAEIERAVTLLSRRVG